MPEKIIKADPRIYLEELTKSEKEIISKIKDLERDLKLQLIELQITRELMDEAIKNIEEGDVIEFTKASKQISENIDKLENVVEDLSEKKKKLNIVNEESPYQLNKEDVKQVTSYETIERLDYLASKKDWTYNEAKEFVQIKYNVVKALDTGFNPMIMNRLESVYKAVEAVKEAKPEVINYNFKNDLSDKVFNEEKKYSSKSIDNFKIEPTKYDVKKDIKK